ncbi:MAG: hypothetical protein IJY75_01505, partial [Bacteroidaceae bacterium]|nr:hypothetical protein [Bacteroidaceae bacterium]
ISKRQNQSVINEYSTGDMITLYDANGKALTSVEISDCIYAKSKYIPWVYFKFNTLDEDVFKHE